MNLTHGKQVTRTMKYNSMYYSSKDSNDKHVDFDINGNNIEKLIGKRKLHRPDYSYIKTIHPEGHLLYNEWIALLDEFDDIMASHQYDSRMLKIEPVRLGLKKEAFNTRIYTPQHNLSASKIKAMEAITIEKEKNEFFIQGNGYHNIPYGMFVKEKVMDHQIVLKNSMIYVN